MRSLILAPTALLVLSFSAAADALPITDTGVLNITNNVGSLFAITSAPFCVNWGGGSTCVAGTTHQMNVAGPSNLFSTAASATDQIKDLPSLPPPTLTDFETVLGAGAIAGQTVHFDLTSIPINASASGTCSGAGANNPLNSCTPANSAFTLTMVSSNVVAIGFNAHLNAYTGTSAGGVTPYNGIFTTQIAGALTGTGPCSGLAANITNILGCEAAGGTVTNTWSATESPVTTTGTVPEPSTMLLLSTALLVVGLVVRKRRFHQRPEA
jgi:hypothetical protein